jgi:hypothetical protein
VLQITPNINTWINSSNHTLSLHRSFTNFPWLSPFKNSTELKVKVTLWLTVSQSVSKSWCRAPSGAHNQILLLFDSYGLVLCGAPWREGGSIICTCCWPLPAQSFSGPSPFGPMTIFYCLRFETSLFIASYDSQGHGGGIRPRLHTG